MKESGLSGGEGSILCNPHPAWFSHSEESQFKRTIYFLQENSIYSKHQVTPRGSISFQQTASSRKNTQITTQTSPFKINVKYINTHKSYERQQVADVTALHAST